MNGHNESEIVEWGYWTAKFLFTMSGKIHRGVKPAHANIGLTLGENARFLLWNIPPNKTYNDSTLDVTVPKRDFVGFLAQLGEIFVNYIHNNQ